MKIPHTVWHYVFSET